MPVEWGETDSRIEPMHVVVGFRLPLLMVRAAPKAMCPEYNTHTLTLTYTCAHNFLSEHFAIFLRRIFFPYLFVDFFFLVRLSSVCSCMCVVVYVVRGSCGVCRCIGMDETSVWCAPAPQCAPIRPIECVSLFHGNLCEIVPPMLRRHTQCSVGAAVGNTNASTYRRIHPAFYFCADFVFFLLSIARRIFNIFFFIVCLLLMSEKLNF